MLNTTVAQRRRKDLGLTLAQVGDLVGVDKSVIKRWEDGDREPQTLDALRRYARALQVDAGELVAVPEGAATFP